MLPLRVLLLSLLVLLHKEDVTGCFGPIARSVAKTGTVVAKQVGKTADDVIEAADEILLGVAEGVVKKAEGNVVKAVKKYDAAVIDLDANIANEAARKLKPPIYPVLPDDAIKVAPALPLSQADDVLRLAKPGKVGAAAAVKTTRGSKIAESWEKSSALEKIAIVGGVVSGGAGLVTGGKAIYDLVKPIDTVEVDKGTFNQWLLDQLEKNKKEGRKGTTTCTTSQPKKRNNPIEWITTNMPPNPKRTTTTQPEDDYEVEEVYRKPPEEEEKDRVNSRDKYGKQPNNNE